MGPALSLGFLCIASINAWLQGTPLGAHVWQGTKITYWRNESQTYIGITYWLPFFCQEQREVQGRVEGNRENNLRRMSTMHTATLVSIFLEVFHIKYGYYVQACP